MSLPFPTSPDFPAALKAAREARGMSRAELARAAGIHAVMPRRYEEPDCGEFTKPTRNTWDALNRALYGGNAATATQPVTEVGVSLQVASLDEIVAELHRRKIGVTLSFPTVQ